MKGCNRNWAREGTSCRGGERSKVLSTLNTLFRTFVNRRYFMLAFTSAGWVSILTQAVYHHHNNNNNNNPLFSHDSVLKLNSLWGRAQMKWNQIKSIHIKSNVGFWGEGKTGVPGEKPLGAEKRTNKLNPPMTPSLGIEPAPHWWEASALTTAPSLLQQQTTLTFIEERILRFTGFEE